MNTDQRVAPTVASQGKHNLHHIFAYWQITAHFAINHVQTQRNNETNSCKSKFRAIKINVKLVNTRAVDTVRKPVFTCHRIKQASSDIPNRLYVAKCWVPCFVLAKKSCATKNVMPRPRNTSSNIMFWPILGCCFFVVKRDGSGKCCQ